MCTWLRSSSERLLGLLNDLLDFSKIEAGQMSLAPCPTELRVCIDETIELYWSRATENDVRLRVSVPPDIPGLVEVDPIRVSQVPGNLLSNAIRFTEGGDVELAVQRESDTHLRFRITDTGIGITPEQQERLFQRFSQADPSTTRRYGGTGPGLAICKNLVEQMDGEIGVQSQAGMGSTFWFTLRTTFLREGPPPELAADLSGKKVWLTGIPPLHRPYLQQLLDHWQMQRVVRFTGSDICIAGPRKDTELRRPRTVYLRQGALSGRWLGETLLRRFNVEARSDEVESTPVANPGLKVLVAEDNRVNQMVTRRLLAHLGLQAELVGDGQQAREALARDWFDVILMDVHMPVCDGLEATRLIRADAPYSEQPTIIALTASAMAEDRKMCEDAGMDDFLTKPLVPEVLLEKLRRLQPRLPTAS